MPAYRPRGLLVPLVTPFTEEDRVDLGSLERLANDLLDAGAAGLVALATTGEAHAVTEAERDEVIAACARVCGDRGAPLVVGAGTNDTRTTLDLHAALAEVPAVSASLAVVPYYVRPSEAAIVQHFEAVAEVSPVPVIVYNIPYRTGRGLGAEALLELAADERIAGVKQAVGGVDEDSLVLVAEAPDSFSVLGGDDAFLLPIVLMGGAGAIAASAQLCTERFAAMIEAGLDGRVAEARGHAEALLPLVRALFAEPSPAVIKAVLATQERIPSRHVRMPLADASLAAVERALDAVAAASAAGAA